MTNHFKRLVVVLFSSLCTAHVMAADTTGAASGNEWTTALGTLQGTRYSNLNQITTENANRLVEEIVVETGVAAGHEGQPLVVNIGTPDAPVMRMFVVTPWPNNLIALQENGQPVWTYKPNTSEYAQGVACCDTVNRGAAYANGLVVYSRLDGYVIAVNAQTGKLAWQTKIADPKLGETLTGAPIIAGGFSGPLKVIVGNAGGEMGIRGWVKGLNLTNGKLAWTRFNTGPDKDVGITANTKNFYAKDQGANLGTTTWQAGGTMDKGVGIPNNPANPSNTLWKQGGSTVWAWFTYDPDLKTVFYGTANPGVWNPDMRPGDNKWSASIFARDPDTGEVKWVNQLTPHDGWDYDSMSESTVISTDSSPSGKALVHFDKNGFSYMLDAKTGQIMQAKPFVSVTWASEINLTTGAPTLIPGMSAQEGKVTQNICPSPLGGKEFSPATFSDSTKQFYVPTINFCSSLQPLKAKYLAGTPFMGADVGFSPDWKVANTPGEFRPFGELIAWNLDGTINWTVPETAPLFGGVLSTAGDVVFYGTLDRQFKVVDAKTGSVIKSFALECGVMSNPITYMGADNIQRVAVYSGVGWLPGGFVGGPCPAGRGGEDGDSHEEDSHEEGGSSGTTAAVSASRSGKLHIYKLQ